MTPSLLALVAALLCAASAPGPARKPGPAPTSAKTAPAGPQGAPKGWIPFTSKQDGFRISLPAPPREEHSEKQTPAGTTSTTTYTVPWGDRSITLVVSRFPAGILSGMPLDQALGTARTSLVDSGWTVLSEKRLTVEGPKGSKRRFPGFDCETRSKAGTRGSIRVILVGDTLYELGYQHRDEDDVFARLVASFSLL